MTPPSRTNTAGSGSNARSNNAPHSGGTHICWAICTSNVGDRNEGGRALCCVSPASCASSSLTFAERSTALASEAIGISG